MVNHCMGFKKKKVLLIFKISKGALPARSVLLMLPSFLILLCQTKAFLLPFKEQSIALDGFYHPTLCIIRFRITNFFSFGQIFAEINVNFCLSPYSPSELIFIPRIFS
jgi:hypothetical protein